MNTSALELFLGKEVKIYPGDTYKKTGILKAIDDTGVVFEVTSSQTKDWVVGELHYVSFANKIVVSSL